MTSYIIRNCNEGCKYNDEFFRNADEAWAVYKTIKRQWRQGRREHEPVLIYVTTEGPKVKAANWM